ncbi:DNA polymerase III subunit delta' [Rheinheimera texasensis]|uniref:DNA polymerase III subunit delta' n=1 Tax=Rheinheimera texasensis TaxID=306205 RepID=UPI0004E106E9|nr:DNA polymerase III subunit delta' [Rheinheimera texasensis]
MTTSLPWLQHTELRLFTLAVNQQLHHAILLTGPEGIGKHILAKQLAHLLLCQNPLAEGACGRCKSCLLGAAGHHPDLLTLEVGSSISVDQIRDISYLLQNAPQQGGARVVVIPQAEKMTESAANALLKTLEEPGHSSYLLLQTAYADQLMPTILSRCQRWDLPAQYSAQTAQWLQQHSPDPLPEFLLELCGGAPLKALELLQSGEALTLAAQLQQLQQFLQSGNGLGALQKQLETQTELPALLYYTLRHWSVQQALPPVQLFQRVAQWCRDEQRILGQNKSLALTTLLLDLHQMLRGTPWKN